MPTSRRAGSGRPLLGALAAALMVVAACGGSSGSGGSAKSGASAVEPTTFVFDAKNFVDPRTSTNQFHPLKPGTQWVRAGTTEVGHRKVPHQVISTMTDVVRVIDGVTVVAMLDQSSDSGEIAQVGFDWFALDKDGNVWILGGYTERYEGGVYTNSEDAWLGAAGGGRAGVLLPGRVDLSTPRWFIAATDKARRARWQSPPKWACRDA